MGKSIHIAGTRVIWDTRDLTQISDRERARIEKIVEREQDADIGRKLDTVRIESEYVDRDQVRYSTITRVIWGGDLDHLKVED